MQAQQPVIRTYRGRDRRLTEEAYRQDALQALRAEWYPVAHRWVASGGSEELSVVFEYRGMDALSAEPAAPQPSPGTAAYVAAEQAAFAEAKPDPGDPDMWARPEEPTTTPATDEPYDVDPWADLGSALTPAAGNEPAPEPEAEAATAEAAAVVEPDAEAAERDAEAAAAPEPEAGPDAGAELGATPAVESGPALEAADTAPDSAEPAVSDDSDAPVEPAPPPMVVAPVFQDDAPTVPFSIVSVQPQTAQLQPSARPSVRAHARAVVQAIDLHAAGEPLRLIRSGFPSVPSLPILERRRWLKQNADYARRVLMWEPRGHRDMYGAILLPPYRADADIAVLFMHNEGYSTMCGHGIIAVTTGLIEEGLYPAAPPETLIRFETPAGLVTSTAAVTRTPDGRNEVTSVRFVNVPSYLHATGLQLKPDGVTLHGNAAAAGALSVDLAFGGAYYGVVDAADLGLRVVPDQIDALTRAGTAITEVLRRDHTPQHPTDRDLGFVYGTIIVDGNPATSPDGRAGGADIRNVTIFADGEVDRSPCGSGTSALLAQMHAHGRMGVGHQIVNAGITGEAFRGRVEGETWLGSQRAVVTSVEGRAYVTGYHTFVVDDRDPLGNGFLLR